MNWVIFISKYQYKIEDVFKQIKMMLKMYRKAKRKLRNYFQNSYRMKLYCKLFNIIKSLLRNKKYIIQIIQVKYIDVIPNMV